MVAAMVHRLHTAKDVIDALGGNRALAEWLAKYVIVGEDAVRKWSSHGSFNPRSHLIMPAELGRRGYSAPHSLWRQWGAE